MGGRFRQSFCFCRNSSFQFLLAILCNWFAGRRFLDRWSDKQGNRALRGFGPLFVFALCLGHWLWQGRLSLELNLKESCLRPSFYTSFHYCNGKHSSCLDAFNAQGIIGFMVKHAGIPGIAGWTITTLPSEKNRVCNERQRFSANHVGALMLAETPYGFSDLQNRPSK